jgi:tripartite-type tricarboxylate transporter receptor subunit TctC
MLGCEHDPEKPNPAFRKTMLKRNAGAKSVRTETAFSDCRHGEDAMAGILRAAFWIAAALMAPLIAAACEPAFAQSPDFPNRKITFVVGFAPGGGIDVLARSLAQELTAQLGYQIVVENRPGAASNVAAKIVTTATPDGYTLLVTGNSFAINQTMSKDLTYSVDELRAVAFPARDSQALAVNADSSAHTLADFIAVAKARPVSAGVGGSSAHIVADYVLKVMAKTQATAVPFQSGLPAMNALLGHHVDIVAGPIVEVSAQVKQGTVRALAVTGPKRAVALPDVPTLTESGYPGLEINGWVGLLAPAKTPTEVCATLNSAINSLVTSPSFNERLRNLGYEPNTIALADTDAFLKNSIDTWRRMILATGLSAE